MRITTIGKRSYRRQVSNFRPLVVLAGLAIGATALALLATAQAGFWLAYQGQPVPWAGLLRARLVDCYDYAAFVPAIYWLARYLPVDREHWPVALPVHITACLVFAFLKETIFVAVGDWFRPGVFVLPDILAEDFLSEWMFFWALTALVHAFIFHQRGIARVAAGEEAERLDHFAVRERGVYKLVRIEDIDWIDAQGNYARLNTHDGRHLVRETMTTLERRLGHRFVRVHRGAIVNRERIARLEARSHGEYVIFLSCGKAIATGRSYRGRLRQILG